jgi:hypothetical protein
MQNILDLLDGGRLDKGSSHTCDALEGGRVSDDALEGGCLDNKGTGGCLFDGGH